MSVTDELFRAEETTALHALDALCIGVRVQAQVDPAPTLAETAVGHHDVRYERITGLTRVHSSLLLSQRRQTSELARRGVIGKRHYLRWVCNWAAEVQQRVEESVSVRVGDEPTVFDEVGHITSRLKDTELAGRTVRQVDPEGCAHPVDLLNAETTEEGEDLRETHPLFSTHLEVGHAFTLQQRVPLYAHLVCRPHHQRERKVGGRIVAASFSVWGRRRRCRYLQVIVRRVYQACLLLGRCFPPLLF